MLVISKSGAYPLWVIVTYSISSAYYTLVLGNKPFPNLLFYPILLYHLHLTTHVNNLVIHPQKKVHWQNLKLIFPVILQVFDLECHGQTSVKVELVMCRLLFMKSRKLKSCYWENEKLDPCKT